MAFARPFAVRGAWRAIRPSRTSVERAQLSRHIGRRCYASHGHGASKASSDIPWAIGALVVTVPSCLYLLQNGPKPDHSHGGHGDEHGNGHSAQHGGEHGEDSKDTSDDHSSGEGDDSDSGDDSKETDTPDTSDDEDEKSAIAAGASGTPKDDNKGMKEGQPENVTEGGDKSKDMPASSVYPTNNPEETSKAK